MTDELLDRLRAVLWSVNGEPNANGNVDETVCSEAADCIEALTAENERMRKELEDIANDYEAGYPLSHDTIKYAARAALKGETP